MNKPDTQLYFEVDERDRWMFNKLEVALRIGSKAGMKEHPVPREDWYIVRPIINLHGMGIDAHFEYIDFEFKVPSGMFWCEIYKGNHYSVDYEYINPILWVQGWKEKLNKWTKWKRITDLDNAPEFPKEFQSLLKRGKYFNIEFIGDKPIEIHPRQNPDFYNRNYDELIPVWNDTSLDTRHWLLRQGYEFIEDYDTNGENIREGFFAK